MFKNKKANKSTFIGYYKPSVILTYIGVISGSLGIYFGFGMQTTYALICLIISGLCDAFDGKVARLCKRTNQEKEFGIQLDSLADLVSFVFLPIAIFYGIGLTSVLNVVIYILFILGGIIRLAYFNTVADQNGPVKYYHGLPVTSTAIIFPIVFLLSFIRPIKEFYTIYTITMLMTSILFILNFELKKPKTKQLLMMLIGGILLITLLLILI